VFAPKISVNFGGTAVDATPAMPSGDIRNVLQTHILPKFTALFAEESFKPPGVDKSGGGDKSAAIDAWLQSQLEELQKVIETKLASVFRNK
jgi:hypothetical protein